MTELPGICYQHILDDLWEEGREFSRFEAAYDLVALTEDSRGEVRESERELAERWGWPRTRVRNFLELLVALGEITRPNFRGLRTLRCAHCGKELRGVFPAAQKCCSYRCTRAHARANRRQRLRDRFVAPVSLDEIFERDRGRCQLCGELVDRTLQWPDPMGVSLDHIIPVSRGGTHEPKNVQLAHWKCNHAKRARVPA